MSFGSTMTWIGSYDLERKSQSRAVPSTDPDTAKVPSSFNFTQLTRPAWPRNLLIIFVFSTSHKKTLLSNELEIIFSESPVESTSVTSRPWPAKTPTAMALRGFHSLIVESFPHDRQ